MSKTSQHVFFQTKQKQCKKQKPCGIPKRQTVAINTSSTIPESSRLVFQYFQVHRLSKWLVFQYFQVPRSKKQVMGSKIDFSVASQDRNHSQIYPRSIPSYPDWFSSITRFTSYQNGLFCSISRFPNKKNKCFGSKIDFSAISQDQNHSQIDSGSIPSHPDGFSTYKNHVFNKTTQHQLNNNKKHINKNKIYKHRIQNA